MTDPDYAELLAVVDGHDPTPEVMDRIRDRLTRALAAEAGMEIPEVLDEQGDIVVVLVNEQTETTEPAGGLRRKWPLFAAAAALALVVAIAIGFLASDDPDDVVAGLGDDALTEYVDAVNSGDYADAMQRFAPDALLDGGPAGWPGWEFTRQEFEDAFDFLDTVGATFTIKSCATGDDGLLSCNVTFDHVGYQALGGPADALLEARITDTLISYFELSGDTRYNQMRAAIVAAETGTTVDAVEIAECTDWRFNRPGCGQLVLDNLDVLRAAAD